MNRIIWNLYSVWGLRGLRRRWVWLVILNRILRKLDHRVLCMCGRYVAWCNVWSVCTNDAFICNECMKESTKGEWDNESDEGIRIFKRSITS